MATYRGESRDNTHDGDVKIYGSLDASGDVKVDGSISSGSSGPISTTDVVFSNQLKNSGSTFTVDSSGNCVVNDLTVSGVSTTVNSTQLTIVDPVIHLAKGNLLNNKNMGLFSEYNDGTTKYRGLMYDINDNKYKAFDGSTTLPSETATISDALLQKIKASDFETATDSLSQIRADIGTLGSTTNVAIVDNIVDAYQIREAGNKYLSMNTTDLNEKIILHKNTDINGTVNLTQPLITSSTLDGVDLSVFKADYDVKVNQDVRSTATPTFAGVITSGFVDGRDISVDGGKLDLLHDTIGLSTLTSSEATQLKNIDLVTISNTQWGYLGALNQSLDTGATASFQNINVNGTVDGVDISVFKSDYDAKIDQDVRTTASPLFVKMNIDDGAGDNMRINTDSGTLTGIQNIMIQSSNKNSLGALTSGSFNICLVSNNSSNSLSSGQYNTLIGSNVASLLSTGSNNICIGSSSNANTTTVDGTISIGPTSDCSNFANTMAIGSNAKVNHLGAISLGYNASSSANNQLSIAPNLTEVVCSTGSSCDLGSSIKKFKDIHISGNINVDGLVDGVDVNAQATAQNTHIADLTIHRSINDSGSATTDLWSANKIESELKKASEGLHAKDGMKVKTTIAFNSYTFTAGIITSVNNELIQQQDGITLALNDRVLVTTEATTSDVHNGLYYVSQLGQAGVSQWQLTRTPDGDEPNEIDNHTFCFIESGNTYANTGWLQSESGVITINTDPINFVQFSSAGIVTASNVGASVGKVFKDKNGNDLRFKSVGAGSSKVSITNGTDDVLIDIVESNIVATGALNSGSISSGYGNIDIGSSILTAGQLNIDTIQLDNSEIKMLSLSSSNNKIRVSDAQANGFQILDNSSNSYIQLDTTVNGKVKLDQDTEILFGKNLTVQGITPNATQWGYLGVLDQNLRTTDTVQFANIVCGGLIDGRDVSVDGATLDSLGTSGITGLTTAEVTQLANIDLNTISNTQWGYLGVLDQNIRTTDTVQFANIVCGGLVDGRDVSVDGGKLDLLHDTIGLSALTSAEVDQLENIGTTTISAPQWNILGSANQASTTSGSSVSHTNVTLTGSLISGSANLNNVDLLKLDGITDGTVSPNKCLVVDSSKDLTGIRRNIMQQLDILLGASEYCIAPSNTLGTGNNVSALQFGSSNTRGFHFYTSSLKFCSDLEGPVGGTGTWTAPALKIQNDKVAINSGNDETIVDPENLQVTGNVSFTGFIKKNITTINQATYNVAVADHIVVQTYTTAVSTITLGTLTSYPVGAEIMIRRGATGKTLTITPFAGQQINGSTGSITENSDWGGYRLTKYDNTTWLACQCV
jgi:hypothetical protein